MTCPDLILGDLIHHPMPDCVHGALLRSVPSVPSKPIRTVWSLSAKRERLPPGAVLLAWQPDFDGGMNVTAHLGLASAEVVLATWPGLRGDWVSVVHPTLYEVVNLYAALTVARDALHLAVHVVEL